MVRTSDDFKVDVLQAIDIVELISQSLALKRRGKDYVGLCPFHQEKSPSFSVSPAKQMFYCYGCKTGGNAIDFVMKRDRLEFVDALRLLGERAGLEMPRSGAAKGKAGEKQVLLDMQLAACGHFEKVLADPERGKLARDYLATRQISNESIQRFRIGLAADAWDALVAGPVGRKFSPPQLALGGLAKPRERGDGYYDVFRNRLMFPIRDESGRVIGFGGRVLSDEQPKYLNSPETPLFSKSRCIFGLDLARQKMVETRTAIVVEGYTDVVIAHQFGLSNVVSVLGTAMTEQHVSILRRFVDRIVLLFDADTAGELAVDRAVGLFLTQPVEIAVASMPSGVDPDEFVLQNGADAFIGLIEQATDALSYKWKQLIGKFDASGGDLTNQQKAVEAYLDLLSSARGSGPIDSLRWGAALARVSRLTDVPMEVLNRRFGKRKPSIARAAQVPASPIEAPTAPLTAQDHAERQILGILLLEPHRWHDVQRSVHLEDFSNERHRRLAEIFWSHQRDEGEPVLNEFLGTLTEPMTAQTAILAIDEVEALAEPDQVLSEALSWLERRRRIQSEEKLLAALRRTSLDDPEEQAIELLRALTASRQKPDLHRT